MMGGLAVVGAALVGSLLAPDVSLRIGIAAMAALALAAYGLVSDRRRLPSWARLLVEVLAGVAVVAGGIQAEVTGSHLTDLLVTVIWLVALPEAIRGLDHTDGLAPGVAAASSAGVFALAAFADQRSIAIFAAAICGCSLGFLAYNLRPASVFLRDSGSLFLGLALAVLIVETDPAVSAPGSYGIGLLLAGVALLDLVFVLWVRFRRGLHLDSTRRDRLAQRLAAVGLSRTGAVWVLVVIQLLLTTIAVFVGRRVLNPLVGTAAAVAIIGVLILAAGSASVYSIPRRRRSRVRPPGS
jgi:UDP-GlcNAc:undecaprenyl-phosphate GlcNAc-1-phosphate transferase